MSSAGVAATDTPQTTPSVTAQSSPIIRPKNKVANVANLPRPRAATTLDIPGLTRSKVSPDGRISQRDLGSKLVIIMVGLPARGKSYITKKIARYLNWLQHDTRIFNVGERRRHAVSSSLVPIPGISSAPASRPPSHPSSCRISYDASEHNADARRDQDGVTATQVSHALQMTMLEMQAQEMAPLRPTDLLNEHGSKPNGIHEDEHWHKAKGTPLGSVEHTAQFFDPLNVAASELREKVAMETLEDLLDFVMDDGGTVGIFDATNSTVARRRAIVDRIRQRAGPDLGIIFLESLCVDSHLLEANMCLKLSGPDYTGQDPVLALADFRERIAMYEKTYVSLGSYEEENNMPFIQMVDVGRKIVSHQIRGFLSAQTVYYLLNFNLAPRQIWITRHGKSCDNVSGKIGGDSDLSEEGVTYAKDLSNFIQYQRQLWNTCKHHGALCSHSSPETGAENLLNDDFSCLENDSSSKNFCVWTSMLRRSIQTAQFFDEEEYEVKQMKMLDELNAGVMEGLTYDEIKTRHTAEYRLRQQDKLHYRYPGAGGEGYLDIINRLRAVIVEIERMTDHVLLIVHRSVARVLLAYFKGLRREEVAELDMPLGMLYALEPKPYGVDFQAYRHNPETAWFDLVPDYELKRAMTSPSKE